jgi:hypothetical protein
MKVQVKSLYVGEMLVAAKAVPILGEDPPRARTAGAGGCGIAFVAIG